MNELARAKPSESTLQAFIASSDLEVIDTTAFVALGRFADYYWGERGERGALRAPDTETNESVQAAVDETVRTEWGPHAAKDGTDHGIVRGAIEDFVQHWWPED